MSLHMLFVTLSIGFHVIFIAISNYRIFVQKRRGTIDHFYWFALGLIFLVLSIAVK